MSELTNTEILFKNLSVCSQFTVATLFPEAVEQFTKIGVMGRAIAEKRLKINTLNFRDFAEGVHKAVDDRAFGGGDGMVMGGAPLEKCLRSLATEHHIIYLSPQGERLTQKKVISLAELSKKKPLALVCGRYAGIDQRLINEFVDEEVSIGDFVLSGGELAALTLLEALSRCLPGVIGNADSVTQDSFSTGLLESPQFTRPADFLAQKVPDVLLSGNHRQIENWKHSIAIINTAIKRPDLLASAGLPREEIQQALSVGRSMSKEEIRSLGFDKDFLVNLDRI